MALRIAPSLESLKNGSQAQPQPVNLFDDVVGKAKKGLSYVADQTFNPLAQLGNVYEAGKQFVSGTGDILGGAARAVGDVAQGNFQGAAQNAGTALMGAGKVAGSPFRALPVIGGLTENMGTGMARGATEALSGVANVAGGLYNFGKGAITAPGSTKPLEGMQQAVRGASQIVSSPFTAGMSSLPTGAQETLGSVMQPVAQAGEGAFDAAVGGLMQAAGLRYDPKSPETQKLKQVINDSLTVIGGISPATTVGKQGIKTAQIAGKDFGVGVKGVVGGAKDVKNTITNALKKAPSDKVKLSERMIQQMYNLDPKTQKILKSGKNQYVQLADKGLFDSQKAVDFITKPLIKRLDDLSDTGKAYGTMRKSGTVIPDIKSTLLVDTLRDKYGISSVRGKLKVTPDSLVSLGKAEVTRLQEAVDFFNKASKGKMDVNKFLNARKSIDKIARFEAGVDTGTLESIGRTLRKELNKYRPEGLSVLDKTLSTEKNILKNAKKYLLDKEGNIKDSAESFISNLGNANKSAQFKKLAEVVPELQEITDALYALKNIERAGSMYSGGSSAVKQTMGAMLGGSVGGIPGAIAGATATNPGVAVSLLKKLGNSRATKAPVITTPKATKVQVPKVKPPIIKNERVNNLYTTLKVTPPKKTPKVKSMSAKSDNGYITLKAESKVGTDDLLKKAKKYEKFDDFIEKEFPNGLGIIERGKKREIWEKANNINKKTSSSRISDTPKYKTTINIKEKKDLDYLKKIFSDSDVERILSGEKTNWRGTPYEELGRVSIISKQPKSVADTLSGKIKEVDMSNKKIYHGTSLENSESILKGGFIPGKSLPKTNFRGGGYDKMQSSISFAETPKEASIFSSLTKDGKILEAQLKKDAKVVSIDGIEDAIDLEEFLPYLKKNKVDAVYIGGGEKEIVVINNKAITTTKIFSTKP